jgi:hypothetical protein
MSRVLRSIGVAWACAFALGCATSPKKPVLGPVAVVRVLEADLSFEGRVDTGAEASSIHATGIELVWGESGDARVRFDLENQAGERVTLERPIADVAEVRSAGVSEQRYRVGLTLAIGDVETRVRATLRDRSAMSHRLLVGRDVLAGRFVVDVSAP